MKDLSQEQGVIASNTLRPGLIPQDEAWEELRDERDRLEKER